MARIKVGEIYDSNNYGKFVVVYYNGRDDIVVRFIGTGYTTNTQASNIRRGGIRDPLAPSVYGVGFIGVGDFKASIKGINTKAYTTWVNMLMRCYSDEFQIKQPTYMGCFVCDEWLNFQCFAAWFERSYMHGYHLDKDIMVDGNKMYSPETCVFVSQLENSVKAHAKSYKFLSPLGDTIEIYNLRDFCRVNSLTQSAMVRVNSGEVDRHKGWARIID